MYVSSIFEQHNCHLFQDWKHCQLTRSPEMSLIFGCYTAQFQSLCRTWKLLSLEKTFRWVRNVLSIRRNLSHSNILYWYFRSMRARRCNGNYQAGRWSSILLKLLNVRGPTRKQFMLWIRSVWNWPTVNFKNR